MMMATSPRHQPTHRRFVYLILRIVERFCHFPRRLLRELLGLIQLLPLPLRNRYCKSPVTEEGGPAVSMTTYGKRARTVYLAIESIARGELRPSRLILWIDEPELFHHLPASLRRLQERGLEVRLCHNYLAHKKYYPYVESQESFDKPLVTADDDVLYPRYWLRMLADAHREHPEAVNCFYAGSVDFDEHSGEMSMLWSSCSSTEPNLCHHPIGSPGVIYPPRYLMAAKQAGTGFRDCCPRHDDLWHHVVALRAGIKVRQILPRPPYLAFQGIPGAGWCAQGPHGVEREMAATYQDSDLQMLRAAYDQGTVR